MSDNFYTMELLAREKARWAEAEMQRRQILAQAPRSGSQGSRAALLRYLGEVMIRAGHFLLRRARAFAG